MGFNCRENIMHIKSLLLGSAAAMVAVSGAQAADAIVVEPEPVEYVRVCDAYGSGFFYIPGTETCIRFSGYVRSSFEKTYIENDNISSTFATGTTTTFQSDAEREFTFWGQRARLNIDTRNETDWGTLRAQYRLEGGDANNDADIDMDRALISLAGFRAGFTDNYWTTNHNYAGVNLTGLGAALTYTIDDGWYGFNDATMFDYTWAGDGFSVTVGVEDPRIDWQGLGNGPTFAGGTATAYANFYAGVNWSADWGGVAFTAVHDSMAFDYTDGTLGGWAYKASIDLDLSEWIPGGVLHGMYMWDNDIVSNYTTTYGALVDPDSVWQVSFQASLTDEVQLVAQYSHAEGSNFATNGPLFATLPFLLSQNEGDAWNASVGINWFPAAAPGFSLRGSYKWGEVDNGIRFGTAPTGVIAMHDVEWHGFFIGVRRDF